MLEPQLVVGVFWVGLIGAALGQVRTERQMKTILNTRGQRPPVYILPLDQLSVIEITNQYALCSP
ncbi:hypothetical protein [Pararhodospirillum oryzae]|uniref:Uncharacterized protein n=1 Tax=Pararhodospirillum oryzae TaxID=478448 RepID=A0A512H829_9PROT|nr:hypothetical protein [Pararhodospirillum oryzae]GEO81594.1 hypothetical protein ROR02_17250 [Pararhodospirillum oryzae]